MGSFEDLANSALRGLKNWGEEANQHYEYAMTLDEKRFLRNYKAVMTGLDNAKKAGYMKAAKERGLR